MKTEIVGVMALFASNCILLVWNMLLHSQISELRAEIQKRRDWQQRQIDQSKERI